MTDPINVLDYELLASEKLTRPALDYYAGGALDEHTLRHNREAFSKYLRDELDAAMALSGCPALKDIDRSLIVRLAS